MRPSTEHRCNYQPRGKEQEVDCGEQKKGGTAESRNLIS